MYFDVDMCYCITAAHKNKCIEIANIACKQTGGCYVMASIESLRGNILIVIYVISINTVYESREILFPKGSGFHKTFQNWEMGEGGRRYLYPV